MPYYDREDDGYKFMDLTEDKEFRQDLVEFFTGGRYNYSDEELDEKGWEGLANDFVEHMRWQTTNETTGLFDIAYVKSKENNTYGKEAFGRLMEAYDRSDGGGTGFLAGVGDYAAAFVTSPTTLATVATAGMGVGSKLAARGTTALSQMTVRKLLLDGLAKGATRQAAVDTVRAGITKEMPRQLARQVARELPKSVTREALGSAGRTFAGTAAVEGFVNYNMGETREMVSPTDYEYTTGMLLRDTALASTLGATLGGVSGAFNQRARNTAFDHLTTMTLRQQEALKVARENSRTVIRQSKTADPKAVEEAMNDVIGVLAPIDESLVAGGKKIKKEDILARLTAGDDANLPISATMDTDTVRSITAAKLAIRKIMTSGQEIEAGDLGGLIKLVEDGGGSPTLPKGMRISQWVSERIQDGTIDTEQLRKFREYFGLSKDQMSMIWASDFSEAGRTLADASHIKKLVTSMEDLASSGVSTIPNSVVEELAESFSSSSPSLGRKMMGWANQVDAAQVAFMTSQLGTTSANILGSGFNVLADANDQMVRGFYRAIVQQDFSSSGKAFRGTFDTIRGMSFTNAEAKALEDMLKVEAPKMYETLFHETLRADKAINYSSPFVRFARKTNFLNAMSDSVFKRGAFYGELNRVLRDSPAYLEGGTEIASVGDLFKYGKSLDDIESPKLTKAMDEAMRITMQRSTHGRSDTFGRAATTLEDWHRKTPFIISQGLGIPFPRYVANHMEFVADYTGYSLAYGWGAKAAGAMWGDDGAKLVAERLGRKSMEDRTARAITGWSLMTAGAIYSAEKGDDTDFTTFFFGGGEESGGTDISRAGGWAMTHLYLGDFLRRYYDNDQEVDGGMITRFAAQMAKLGGGVDIDMGISTGLIGDIYAAAKDPTPNRIEAVQKSAGRFVSVFAYPVTVARDVVGQVDPNAAPTPYTRNFLMDDFFGNGFRESTFWQEMTKALPDVTAFEFFKTRGTGQYDRPAYDGFHSEPIGSVNPITNVFGAKAKPKPNEITRELVALGLDQYEVYGYKPYSAALDYATKELLSKSMSNRFTEWRDSYPIEEFGGLTYDQLSSDSERKSAIRAFVRQERRKAEDAVNQFVQNEIDHGNVRGMIAFVRGDYVQLQQQLKRSHPEAFVLAAQDLSGDGTLQDPEAWILSADDPQEMAQRRFQLTMKVREMTGRE